MLAAGGEHAAIARNVQFDHRVSMKRQSKLNGYFKSPFNSLSLRNAIDKYFDKEIRELRNPAFLDESENGDNIVHGGRSNKSVFDEHLPLATMLNLNGLGWEYQKGPENIWPEFGNFPAVGDDSERLRWLDEKLRGKSDEDQRTFVNRVLERLKESRKTEAFQPVWVTFWDSFEPYFEAGPDRWCEIIGRQTFLDAVWIVVLSYTVSEAGTLVRPTQLEARTNGWHFPSPPPRPVVDGGCAMDLGTTPTTDPIPEYVHQQIDLHPHYIRAVGRTSYRTAGRLRQNRIDHRRLLDQGFSGLANWMPDPV
jgi:hypothetical protein